MYIIIIGCGRLGSTLAMELSDEGHDVVIIDEGEENLNRLGSGFNGRRIKGIEYDNDVLIDAGIDRADVFLAMTQDDNINATAAQIAKNIFSVPRVIARIFEPEKQFVYEKLGIEAINPNKLGVDLVRNRIIEATPGILAALDNNILIIEIPVSKIKLKSVEEIQNEYSCRIFSIFREGKFALADDKKIIQKGDKIVCAVNMRDKARLIAALTREMVI